MWLLAVRGVWIASAAWLTLATEFGPTRCRLEKTWMSAAEFCCIGLIGVDMHFKTVVFRNPDKHVTKDQVAAIGINCNVYNITVFDSKVLCVIRCHVNVAPSADYTFFERDGARGALQSDSGAPANIA